MLRARRTRNIKISSSSIQPLSDAVRQKQRATLHSHHWVGAIFTLLFYLIGDDDDCAEGTDNAIRLFAAYCVFLRISASS